MKRILITATFLCVLSATAMAGDIPLGGFAPPQPPNEPTQTSNTTVSSDIPIGEAAQPSVSDEVIINVLGTLCALVF